MQPILMGVYGTLKRGHYNHSLIKDAIFKHKTLIPGVLWVNKYESYPRFRYNPSSNTLIEMEVYEVTPEQFNRCTRMEVGAGYIPRVIINSIIAWESLSEPDKQSVIIESGIYAAY